MILQALHDLYDRFERDPEYDVAPEGYSLQRISFVIVLSQDGSLHGIQDHREGEGAHRRPRVHLVPGEAKPSGSGINPCLLWDNTGYLLGYKPDDLKPDRTRKTFEASRKHHLAHERDICHSAFSAVCRFLEKWDPLNSRGFPVLEEITTGFGVFQIQGTTKFVHEETIIKKWWASDTIDKSKGKMRPEAPCLITGKFGPVADLHNPKIKGVKDSQGAGALIVSFNTNACESLGKTSGMNAPVSEGAAAKYSKSLNALLSSKRHCIQIADATTVFWTETPTITESVLRIHFSGGETGETDTTPDAAQSRQFLDSLQSTLRSLQKGGQPDCLFAREKDKSFYILGLTGQAGGRIGVRFWHRSSIGDLLERLAKHHADLAIQRYWEPGPEVKHPDPEFPRIWQLLRQTARDSKDIPPNLAGTLVRAILTGCSYPQLLPSRVAARICADREVNYLRAAILKAWLTRNHNLSIPMTYDPNKSDTAYRLGALFAVLEKTQRDALGDVDASIRDRYYSSASSTPASVFPRLLRTYQHHLSKAGSESKGYQIHREREVQAILAEPVPFENFPSHFNLREQGLFAIGYYHKRKDLWTKKARTTAVETDGDIPSE